MELALYVANWHRLQDLDGALHSIAPEALPSYIDAAMFGEHSSAAEYRANLTTLRWLESLGVDVHAYERIYFGQEFCEALMPPPSHVEQAYCHARQLDCDFTYVTGYVTDVGLAAIRRNLTALTALDPGVEVVVNDWGVLRLLRREFPTMLPVLGRLLVKQIRLGRHNRVTRPPPVNMTGIQADELAIRERQVGAYRDIDLANPAWRETLHALGVHRADLDITPQGLSQPEHGWPDLPIGFYFPWGYLASGRNCMTAAIEQPERQFVPLDGVCKRPCQRLNRSAVVGQHMGTIVQRGNAVFILHDAYAGSYADGTMPCDRLIFQPYIPI